jgi:hypothetical protein
MSRKTRARRRTRRARAPSKRLHATEATEPRDSGPPLTSERRSRVASRYSEMRFRSCTVSFVPMFDTWFEAKNPEELDEAVRRYLLKDAKDALDS